MDPDEGVTATNNDAALCKFQAVSRGYYKDPFLEYFINARFGRTAQRKAPEINRGYYVRSAAVTYIVEKFLENHEQCQIISLGAGYDTLYWRLKSHGLAEQCTFVELDMSQVTQHKSTAIRRIQTLNSCLSNIETIGEDLHSDAYHLLSVDLRQINKESISRKFFEKCKLSPNKPTLCLAECVFVYMPIQDSDSVIRFLSSNFFRVSLVNYEQCNMKDKFGKIMMENMNARHCDLMGVDACESLESQVFRFTTNNLVHTTAWTLSEIYSNLLLPVEVERIEQLEFLDEKELLDQLLQHYCIVLASNQQLNWINNDEYWFFKSIV